MTYDWLTPKDIKILYILRLYICTRELIVVSYTCDPVEVGFISEPDVAP